MHRAIRKSFIRVRVLGLAMFGVAAAAVSSGSCFFEPRTTVCEATGVRCPPEWSCTAEQDACTQDSCGDGLLAVGEDCDDGNKRDDDGCSPRCTKEECGNGTLERGEECDDQNLESGDGCSATCVQEACGNQKLDPTEECDTGSQDSRGCNYPKDGVHEGLQCTFVRCGDGYTNSAAGEQCDTGGVVDSTCNIRCQKPLCGDGFYDPPMEDCDAGGLNTFACNGKDNANGLGNCRAPRCGDRYVNPAFRPRGAAFPEECDDGGNTDKCNGDDNLDGLGNCRKAKCGDGYVNPKFVPSGSSIGEQCDDGAANSDSKADACRTSCRKAYCGDGVEDDHGPGDTDDEQCDEGAANSNDLANACRRDCRKAFCGDGVVDPGNQEQCDVGAVYHPSPVDQCPDPKECQPLTCTCQ